MPYFGINQCFLSPKSVRFAPESVCGMPRNRCAVYSGISVRNGADFAIPPLFLLAMIQEMRIWLNRSVNYLKV